jgi:hypothetical protein
MIIQKNILFSVVLSLFVSAFALASETNELKIEIKAFSSEIKVGEPLILEIHVTCKTPNINSKTGEIITSGGISAPYLFVSKKGQKEEIKYESKYTILNKPLPVFDKGKKGLEYTGSFIAFYDQNKKGLLFNEPGVYSCRLESIRDKIESNTIEINVKPASKQEQKALSILTAEFDLAILEADEHVPLKDFPGALERFKQVVEQCPDTMLAKMDAAQLGLNYFEEFHQKHPSFEKFKAEYQTGKIQEPLFEQSLKYLSIGAEVPDEFPIRQAVLGNLSSVEFMKSNLKQAFSLITELATKYPNSEYGKKAIIEQKEQIPRLKESYPDWDFAEPNQLQSNKLLSDALPTAIVVGAVVILAAGGILLYKKKTKSQIK